jgi:hypothetical protein
MAMFHAFANQNHPRYTAKTLRQHKPPITINTIPKRQQHPCKRNKHSKKDPPLARARLTVLPRYEAASSEDFKLTISGVLFFKNPQTLIRRVWLSGLLWIVTTQPTKLQLDAVCLGGEDAEFADLYRQCSVFSEDCCFTHAGVRWKEMLYA